MMTQFSIFSFNFKGSIFKSGVTLTTDEMNNNVFSSYLSFMIYNMIG